MSGDNKRALDGRVKMFFSKINMYICTENRLITLIRQVHGSHSCDAITHTNMVIRIY